MSFVTPPAAIAASISAGSAVSCREDVTPRYRSGLRKQSSCAQWKSGRQWSETASSCSSPSAMQLVYCANSAPEVRMAPLGRDSVPLVNIIWIGSSDPTSCQPSLSSSWSRRSDTGRQPSGVVSPAWGIANFGRLFPFCAIAASATGQSASSHSIIEAPEWPRIKATSSAFSMKLIGVVTAPSRASAKRSTTKLRLLWDRSATRSPFFTPSAASAFAARFTAVSSSAKVSD